MSTYTIGRGGRATKQFLDDVLVPLLDEKPVAPRRVYQDLRAETTFVGREGVSEFTVAETMRFANALDVPLGWLEEPLQKGDYDAYADLRRAVDVPIALGENAYNPTQFKQVLAGGAADVLQPDVCRVGGVTPWVGVVEAAALWNTPVSPHYVEPLHVHLAAPFDEVVESPLELEDGGFLPPDEPGHGMAFDGLEQYEKA